MAADASFENLLTEAEAEPVEGWDFSWFDGRATEERPSWGYSGMMAERMAGASAALDIQTGGGEVLAEIAEAPALLVATESWPPNLSMASRRLGRLGGTVVQVANSSDLPFRADSFDLVVSRHPVTTVWGEIGRVLRRGGTYLSQQVGAGSVRELTDFMMGPQPVGEAQSHRRVAAAAEAAGLDVVDLRHESLHMEFCDAGAVVYFLRKVIWIVPGFTVDAYHSRLVELHERIRSGGPFVAHAERFLIEARQPA